MDRSLRRCRKNACRDALLPRAGRVYGALRADGNFTDCPLGQRKKQCLTGKSKKGRPITREATLSGVPRAAWGYKLRNRSVLEWMLDQYKEKKPKDPTIREKFDTYGFADHKENVTDLLMRVSVEMQAVIASMRFASR